MADRWLLIDEMVSLASNPVLNHVRLAVLRAAAALARVAAIRGADGQRLEQAREALDAALVAASSARSLVARARAERNRSA